MMMMMVPRTPMETMIPRVWLPIGRRRMVVTMEYHDVVLGEEEEEIDT
jgi:hypothetical protein